MSLSTARTILMRKIGRNHHGSDVPVLGGFPVFGNLFF